MTLLGEAGLRRLARINHANAVKLAESLAGVPGVKRPERHVLQRVHGAPARQRRGDRRAARRTRRARRRPGFPAPARRRLEDLLLVASTEVNRTRTARRWSKS